MLFEAHPEIDIHEMSPLALAFAGDAVLELLVRQRLVETSRLQPGRLHSVATHYVSAHAQNQELALIEPMLDVYKRQLTALFRCLYKSHPIRDDIAGTTQSIAELTPELLYACTDAFYRPGNMVLSVAGNIKIGRASCRERV